MSGSKIRFAWIALLAAACLGLGGCFVPGTYEGGATGYVVYDAPPPARVVVRPAQPYANAVWVQGHWQWDGAQWVWQSGSWIDQRPGYVWTQPRWERRGRGWVYVRGDWRAERRAERRAVRVQVREQRRRQRVRVRRAAPVQGRARVQVEVR